MSGRITGIGIQGLAVRRKPFRRGVLCACLIALFLGCNTPVEKSGSKTILASFYPVYITVFNIADGVPGVHVVNMAKSATGCLHDYELSPVDMALMQKASVFVVNGAGMESFLEKAMRQFPRLTAIEASRGIPMMNNAADGDPNPHVWVGITGAIAQANNIADGLARWDTAHAEQYRANAARYINRLDSLRAAMHAALDTAARRDIITFHEAFPYFAQEFNLNVVAVIEREPGAEPSARELAGIITLIREKKGSALFAEPQYPAKAAQVIARETGTRLYFLDPAVSGPMEKDAYIKIMERNMAALSEALN